MRLRSFVLLMGAALMLTAAEKKIVGTARGENQDFILHVTLYLDPASVKELIGTDLDGHFILADVKVEPKYGKEIAIDRDDFVLRTDKDGEKTTPFAPSQIAGRETLVVSQKKMGGGEGSPLYLGRAPDVNSSAVVKDAGSPADSALEKVLTEKVLPEKKTDQPTSGLLYFSMEKQKMKDMELTYGGRGENRIALRFKPQ